MPNLFPYTNTHELNLDWVLQVVKDFQTKYTTFDQALADALEAIETAKEGSLEDMQTALTNALDAIDAALANIGTAESAALEHIATSESAALESLQASLTTALNTLTEAQTDAATVINNLYNTLPASTQQILGQLTILDSIITGYNPEAFTWLQGSYIWTGEEAPTPPAINTDADTYTHYVSSRYMAGVAGRRLRVKTDGIINIIAVLTWYNTPPGGAPGGFVPGQAGQTLTFADILLPLTTTAISIELAKPDPTATLSPSEVPGHIEIEWVTDFVNQAVIAPKETSLTADVARNVGEYFFWEGVLYKATANIAVGDTIILSGAGANCEEAQIGADLTDKITAPSSPTTGQFLQWSGSAWVAADLPVYQGGVNNG